MTNLVWDDNSDDKFFVRTISSDDTVLDVTTGTDFLMTFASTKRVVILSEAKDLLSCAPFLRLHYGKQVARVVHGDYQRHSSSGLGAQAQRVPRLHQQIQSASVYFKTFKYVGNAIAREKAIKGWLRSKKVSLIQSGNPTWEDLSEGWYGEIAPLTPKVELEGKEKAGPSLRSG